MKRNDVVKFMLRHHCRLEREGARHSIFKNESNGKISSVPRHNEIDDFLVKKIYRDLGIEEF